MAPLCARARLRPARARCGLRLSRATPRPSLRPFAALCLNASNTDAVTGGGVTVRYAAAEKRARTPQACSLAAERAARALRQPLRALCTELAGDRALRPAESASRAKSALRPDHLNEGLLRPRRMLRSTSTSGCGGRRHPNGRIRVRCQLDRRPTEWRRRPRVGCAGHDLLGVPRYFLRMAPVLSSEQPLHTNRLGTFRPESRCS
jgi:hypothetical protein